MDDITHRIRDLELWAREVEGHNNAKWAEQERHNLRCTAELSSEKVKNEKQFSLLFAKLSKLEVRVAAYAASATALVTLLSKYL